MRTMSHQKQNTEWKKLQKGTTNENFGVGNYNNGN